MSLPFRRPNRAVAFCRINRAVALGPMIAVVLGALTAFAPAHAGDLNVLTAGAFKPALLDLAPAWQAASHDSLIISNDTAGGVAARVVRGEDADLVILPATEFDHLIAQGRIAAGSVVPIAKSGIGVAIKAGTPAPVIDSTESFRQAILAAPSIAYIDPSSGGSSGVYLTDLFARLGIAAQIKPKAVLVPGGLVGSRVDDGEAQLGLQQISELLAVRGLSYVGPLPPELQHYTVYAGGIPTTARRPAAARALLTFLRGDAASRALNARGLEHP
jgi:molybdate transport system substrate-binding protein